MVRRDLFRNVFIICIMVVIFVLLRLFWFTPHHVTEKDVQKGLEAADYVLAFHQNEIPNESIVLYEVDQKEYVGRVIAQGGERAVYMDDVLYVNHEVKDEPYIRSMKNTYQGKTSNTGNLFTEDFTIESLTQSKQGVIGQEEFLILNDNRLNHEDSRQFGLVQKDQIKGIITFRLTPLGRFGFIDVE